LSTVLVTGGSGFIGSHCILQLLAAGHRVRTTVRSLDRVPGVRYMLQLGGAPADYDLSFFVADLESNPGWREAVEGCEYVLHVASPFPARLPKHEDELILPAREGTLRVLRAARDAGVWRVVLTSSFAAIGYGHKQQDTPFDENWWTDHTSGEAQAYVKSKTFAERAAWRFISSDGVQLSGIRAERSLLGAVELAVINPVSVFGPVLGPDYATSVLFVQRLLDGAIPGCPNLALGAVDVRDVADLHIRAMTHPAAAGERFLAVAGDFLPIVEIARILKSRLGQAARRVPSHQLPDWLVRLAALRDPAVRQILPELGKKKNATSAKARFLLGWSPRPAEEAIVATAESLLRLGLVGNGRKNARKLAA
jgi:nucleoside-diphosphate-sugar epimerase